MGWARARYVSVILALALGACSAAPLAPIAQITVPGLTATDGGAIEVNTGQTVTLSGTESSAPAGGALSYDWRFASLPPGSAASFDLPAASVVRFTADVPGDYVISLAVAAGPLTSPAVTVTVTASRCGSAVPTVGALVFTPATVSVGTPISLAAPNVADEDNSGTCNLGQTFSYAWSIIGQPSGSKVKLISELSTTPSFTPDRSGSYVVQLVVTDSTGLSSTPAQLTISAGVCGSNGPQITKLESSVASPGVGAPVQLLSTVTDADNLAPCSTGTDPTVGLSYRWTITSLPGGSSARLNAPTVANPSFIPDVAGSYTFALVVSDAHGLTSTQSLTIVASGCGANVPVAFVTVPSSVPIGASVQLTATISDDDITVCNLQKSFSYAWTLVALPVGSEATLLAAFSVAPSFTPDVPGDYTIQLIVTDSSGIQSAPVLRTITASTCGTGVPSIDAISAVPSTPNPGQQVLATPTISDPDSSCSSFDPTRTYAWTLLQRPAGSNAFILAPTASSARFVADLPGAYQLELRVTNAHGATSPPAVLVVQAGSCGFAAPQISSATASSLTPDPGQSVSLSATVVDADDAPPCNLTQTSSLRWFLVSAPAGSTAVLSIPTATSPTFVPDLPGGYLFSAIATDSTGLVSSPAFVQLSVTNCGFATPTVSLSPTSFTTQPGSPVALTAVPSDADSLCGVSDAFTYQWSIVQAPPGSITAGFSDPRSPAPVFTPDVGGGYTLQVVVTDTSGRVSAPAFSTITATTCDKLPPEIAGGIDVTGGSLGVAATFTAHSVSDLSCTANGALSYAWTLVHRPIDSSALLTTPDAATAGLIPDVAGAYQVSLVITDSNGLTSSAAFGMLTVAPFGGATIQFGDPAILTSDEEPDGSALPDSSLPHVGTRVVLTANATETVGTATIPLTFFSWALISRPSGSVAQLSSTSAPTPAFAPDLPGQYQVSVSVGDSMGTRSPAQFLTVVTDSCGFNPPQVAIAGAATASLRQAVALTVAGGTATDADADPATCPARFNTPALSYSYQWSIASEPPNGSAVLSAQDGAATSFTAFAPSAGGQDYQVQLTATASNGQSASALQTIQVMACGGVAPVVASISNIVTAGSSGNPKPGALPAVGDNVQLVANAIDGNTSCGGTIRSFAWQLISAPVGSAVSSHFATGGDALAFQPDLAGSYVFSVVATDSTGLASAAFTVTIATAACHPVLQNQLVTNPSIPLVGVMTVLGFPGGPGTPQLSDVCVASPAFQAAWTLLQKPAGSTAVLRSATVNSVALTPDIAGNYLAQVVYTDQGGFSSVPATISFAAAVCGTAAPQFSSAPITATPASPNPGTTVVFTAGTIDDSGNSSCAAGSLTPYRYAWSLLESPAGSAAALSSSSSNAPALVPDLPGSYIVGLVVTDAIGNSTLPVFSTLSTNPGAPPICGQRPELPAQVGSASAFTATQQRYDGAQVIFTSSAGGLLDARVPVQLSANIFDPNASCGQPLGPPQITWSLFSVPVGSALHTGALASNTFTPDIAGAYAATIVTRVGNIVGTQTFFFQVGGCGTHAPAATAFSASQSLSSGVVLSTSAPAGGSGAQRLAIGAPVQLGASVADADAQPTCSMVETDTLAWSLLSVPLGSQAQLDSTSSIAPSFTADLGGNYVVQLIATDATGLAGPAETFSLQIDCGASPPIAIDASGLPAFSAQQTVPALFTSGGTMANFAIEHTTLANGAPPAEPTYSFYQGVRVLLAANAVDPDAVACGIPPRNINYQWSFHALPPGSTAVLANEDSARPTFTPDAPGEYDLQLQLSDDAGHSATQVFSVAQGNALIPVNGCGAEPLQAQIAVLGPNPVPAPAAAAAALIGDTISLQATSFDPNVVPLDLNANTGCGLSALTTYQWTLQRAPPASQAAFSSNGNSLTSFVGDLDGLYQVALVATDGSASSSPQILSIDVDTASATRSTLIETNATEPIADGVSAANLLLTAKDAQGNIIAGVPVSFAIASAPANGGVLSGASSHTDLNGTAAVNLTTTDASGPFTVTATVGGVQITSKPIAFASGPGCQIVFQQNQEPTDFNFGTSTVAAVNLLDQFGNLATAPLSVQLSLGVDGSPHQDAQLSATNGTTETITNGALTVRILVSAIGAGYELKVAPSAAGFQGCNTDHTGSVLSTPFAVDAINPLPIAPASLNRKSIHSATATLKWPAATQPAGGGAVTPFSYRLTCTGASSGVHVLNTASSPGTITGLVANESVMCQVTALDAIGEESTGAATNSFTTPTAPAPGQTTGVTAQLTGSDEVAVMWVIPTANPAAPITDFIITEYIAGVAQTTFPDNTPTDTSLIIDGLTTGTTYTFTVIAEAAGNNAGAESDPSNAVLAVGDPSQLVFVAQPPGTAISDVPFSQAVTVAIEDSAGDLVSTASANITLTPSTGGKLAGTNPQPTASGVATFSLTLDGAPGNYTLSAASDTSLSSLPSNSIALTTAIQGLATGATHSCAIFNGGAQCWGDNSMGELGNNSTSGSNLPVQVVGLTSGVTAIAAGDLSTCAVVNGAVQCWGDNGTGQLGNNSTAIDSLVPVAVGALTGATAVTAGAGFNCAIVGGGVWCWGVNGSGELGAGLTASTSPVAVPVSGSSLSAGVQAISAGGGATSTCAIDASGNVWCWGFNGDGELGNNSTDPTSVPTQVSLIGTGATASAISVGYEHSCALVSGGVQCWGNSNEGELGDGTTTASSVPVAISGLTSGVLAIAAGGASTCATQGAGPTASISCWGFNGDGELGDGSFALTGLTMTVTGLTDDVQIISAGGGNNGTALFGDTCVLIDGQVQCWGAGGSGQLGNNATANSDVPALVVAPWQ